MDDLYTNHQPPKALNIENYLTYIQHLELTEDQQKALLHTLWILVENFVDRAFEADCAQQIIAERKINRDKPGNPILESRHDVARFE